MPRPGGESAEGINQIKYAKHSLIAFIEGKHIVNVGRRRSLRRFDVMKLLSRKVRKIKSSYAQRVKCDFKDGSDPNESRAAIGVRINASQGKMKKGMHQPSRSIVFNTLSTVEYSILDYFFSIDCSVSGLRHAEEPIIE